MTNQSKSVPNICLLRKPLNDNHLYVDSNTLSTDERYWQKQVIDS